MRVRTARRLAHGLWLATAVMSVAAFLLILLEEPSEAILGLFIGVPTAIYGTVGALIARQGSQNPIGWLFSAVALSLSLWWFGLSYAHVGAVDQAIGTLPGATAALWMMLWPVAVLCIALPTFILVFPEGRLRSPRWRIAVGAAVLGGVLAAIGMAATIERYSSDLLQPPGWLLRIPSVRGYVAVGITLSAGAALAGLVALGARYSEAEGARRQQLRLLFWMLVAMAAVLPAGFLGWIGFILIFLVDGGGILFGIPAATAIAVLTFGLYDVGVVLKKTIVYSLLVVFLTLFVGLLIFAVSPIGTGTADGGPVARIVTGLLFVALTVAATWRLVRRMARRIVYGKRATPYEAMAEFSERLGEAYATDDVLPRMAEIVRASTGAEVARVWLHVGMELRPVASAPGHGPEPPILATTRDELPEMAGVGTFPVRHRAELLGALTVEMPAAEPLSKTGEKLLTDLAGQAGLVLRNVRLIEELQESRRRIVTAQDERARKLERDLHDGAQQQLVALSVKVGLAEQLSARDPEKAKALLGELRADAGDALENLRDLARGIYPPLLADRGLVEALNAQARKAPVPVSLEPDGVGRYPQEIEAAVYYCCLEALQNMGKYSEASRATVRIAESNGDLTFSVTDDGSGFDTSSTPHGSGLTNMRDRVEALGGALEISSMPGAGTTVAGRVPAGRSGP